MGNDELKLLRMKLKQGDYDEADIMNVWFVIDELIELRKWRDLAFEVHPNIYVDIENLAL